MIYHTEEPKSELKKLLIKSKSKKCTRSISVLRPIVAKAMLPRVSRSSMKANSYQQLDLKEQTSLFCSRKNVMQLFKKKELVKFCVSKTMLISKLKEKCKIKPQKVINMSKWNTYDKF